jgi:hypothetical protein
MSTRLTGFFIQGRGGSKGGLLRETGRECKEGVLYFSLFSGAETVQTEIPSGICARRPRGTAMSQSDEFVIKGVTLSGNPFRPSDWAERLCGIMSAFGGDNRMQYSPYVHPVISAGVKCVVVDVRLKEIEPMAYNFLLHFARDNELQVRPGRGERRPEDRENGSPA